MVIFGDFPYSALFGLAGYVMTTGVFCGVRPVLCTGKTYIPNKDGPIGGKFWKKKRR